MTTRVIQTVEVGQTIWVPAPKGHPDIFQLASVLALDEFSCTARTLDGSRLETLDLTSGQLFLANKSVEADMTGLHYIHEPGIMYNLEQRSFQTQPYTFMGSVLVAVNPFRRVENPSTVGTRQVLFSSHPYAVAESSFQQMTFQGSQELIGMEKGQPGRSLKKASQSIVVGGESGAGKTESSKLVLQQLVTRQKKGKGGDIGGLDTRLLGTNPILEAFGNASTLRNPNSSRFGKMLRLHFDPPATSSGTDEEWTLRGASVQSYLLERSRVTTHEPGERGYHIMYYVIAGGRTKEPTMAGLGLDSGASTFRYTSPVHPKYDDKWDDGFVQELVDAMNAVGFTGMDQKNTWEIIAAVCHMGNIEFGEKDTSEGATSFVANAAVIQKCASLLGVDVVALTKIFCERRFEVAGKEMMTVRNARAAGFARDAVAKAVYSALFDWILKKIDLALGGASSNPDRTSTIGVLDIFGFETFAVNGFEQLLINYTNEALQGTFNSQIFIAEAALYQREGLYGSESAMGQPLDNGICIELLQGNPSLNNGQGLLMTIDSEGRVPDPSDSKMLQRCHTNFGKHPCMVQPHPKDKAQVFIVKHYAATVTYTIGTFLEKNNDRLPDDMESTLKATTKVVLKEMFELQAALSAPVAAAAAPTAAKAAPPAKPGQKGAAPPARKPPARSIVHKFQGQIKQLVDDLEMTKCSFIRCVKPNSVMARNDADPSWFNRLYVKKQLDALNVSQTAEVLRNGFPTRIEYSVLVETYIPVLPPTALRSFHASKTPAGSKDNKSFVRALFYMFDVAQDSYKLGLTKVFFKGGKLAELDKVMKQASAGVGPELVKKFTYYYARVKWRKAATASRVVERFKKVHARAVQRIHVATMMQSLFRMQVRRRYFVALHKGAVIAQKLFRGRKARKAYRILYNQMIDQIRKRQAAAIEEAKRQLEEAKKAKNAEAIREAERKQQEQKEAMEKQMREEEEKAAREAEAQLRIQEALEHQKLEEMENEQIFQGNRRMSMMPRGTNVMQGGKLQMGGKGGKTKLKRGGPPPLPPPPPMFDEDEPPPPPEDDFPPPPPEEEAPPINKRKMSFFVGIAKQQQEDFQKPSVGTLFLKREEQGKGLKKLLGGKKVVWEKVHFVLDKPGRLLSVSKNEGGKVVEKVLELKISPKAKAVRNREDKQKPNGVTLLDPSKSDWIPIQIAFDNEAGCRKFMKEFDECVVGFKASVPDGKTKEAKMVDLKVIAQLNLLLYRKQISQKEFDELFARAQADAASSGNKKPTEEEAETKSKMEELHKLEPLMNPFVLNIPYMRGKLSCASMGMMRKIDGATFEETFMLGIKLRFFLSTMPDKEVGWEVQHKFEAFAGLKNLLCDPSYCLTSEARLAIPDFPTLNYGSYAKRINREHNEGLCKQVEDWVRKFFKIIPFAKEEQEAEEAEEEMGTIKEEEAEEDDPANWRTVRDPESGEIYWNNRVTGEIKYEDPLEGKAQKVKSNLPPNWEEILDPDTNEVYFYNTKTEETQWERPVIEVKVVIKKFPLVEMLHVGCVSDFFDLKGNVEALMVAAEEAKKGKE